jgi:hypothetical protein
MKQVTREDRDRREHLPDCAGYEDCACFGEYVTYAEMWDQQQHIEAQQDECERLMLRIAKLRARMQRMAVETQVAAASESVDYITQCDIKEK